MRRPQLKTPEVKAPRVLVDLFYDLHDRRLLPLVALVLVAIVAVPLVLGSDAKVEPPPPPASATISTEPGSQAARLTVVEASPGLRDYRKRLGGRTPTDPFKQRYTGPVLKGSELNSQTTTSSTSSTTGSDTTTTTTTTTDVVSPSGSSGGDGDGSGGGGEPQLTFFTFAIDVKIVRSEGGESESSVKRGVKPATPLPGEKAPVVTYMGARDKGSKALLMISNNVKAVFGDGKCLSGTDICQLVEVEPGFPQTFVYGPNDVRYRINVLKIEPVITGHS